MKFFKLFIGNTLEIFSFTFEFVALHSFHPGLRVTPYADNLFINLLNLLNVIKADLGMSILVAMNGEWVEGLVMQMRSLTAGLPIDLARDIIMGCLVC